MGWRRRLRLRGGHRSAHEARYVPVPESTYRRDVQGLRAVAVLLVVLDHAGVAFLSGGYVGVDVFFVLSGFLITGLLLAGTEKHGYVSFVDFYIRRAKRILPAATLTLVVTIVASYFLLNVVRAREAIWDSLWASLFGANIRFAEQETDYFAQGQPPSPIQHYWSLSVEEQFYFVWPALLAVALFGAALSPHRGYRRGARNARVVGRWAAGRLLVVVLLAAAVSLAWSLRETNDDPTGAYFSTLTRAWELAFGAILAIAAAHVARLPTVLKVAMSWLGLAAIGVASVAFSPTTAFPGHAALLPTLGTVLVIAAGCAPKGAVAHEARGHAGRLLATRPMGYVGDRSYAFYLWHWPVLMIAAQYEGRDLSVITNVILVAAAFVLSIASYALVENPIRRSDWSPSATWTLVPASTAAVAAAAMFTLTSIDAKLLPVDDASAARATAATAAVRAAAQPAAVPGARSGALPAIVAAVTSARKSSALPSNLTPPVDRLLDREYLYVFPNGCVPVSDEQATSGICRLGASSSRRTLVLFGDSHAMMWMPTILGVAARDGWAVVPLVKSGCVPSAWTGRGYSDRPAKLRQCHRWFAWASRQAKALRPDVVLLGGCCAGALEKVKSETIKAYTVLTQTVQAVAKRVIVIGDPEGVDKQPVDCLLGRRATMRTCTTVHSDERFALNDDLAAVAEARGFDFLHTRAWFCHERECPMVVGRTVVYRDTGHITAPYALSLVEPFRAAFKRCVTRVCPG